MLTGTSTVCVSVWKVQRSMQSSAAARFGEMLGEKEYLLLQDLDSGIIVHATINLELSMVGTHP